MTRNNLKIDMFTRANGEEELEMEKDITCTPTIHNTMGSGLIIGNMAKALMLPPKDSIQANGIMEKGMETGP